MSEKKDFLSSLAEELNESKNGNTTTRVKSFEDYKQEKTVVHHEEYEEEPVIRTKPVNNEPTVKSEPKQTSFFAANDKPSSFQEETYTRIEKKKVKLNPKGIIVLTVLLLLLGGLSYFLFFAPKIAMENFVGRPLTEVTAWARQHGVENTAVALNYEYSLDVKEGNIINQNVDPGKKIKKNTPLTFVVSNGADPGEEIMFPNIMSMTYDEVKSWISDNQLTKTKINTVYNETVPENEVISYTLKSGSESEFTRGATLQIDISRGPAPAKQITMEDFTGKMISEVESWAKSKNLVLKTNEAYNDKVEVGKVISQNIEKGATVKEGAEFVVTVSKGQGTVIPNLVGYDDVMLETWKASAAKGIVVITRTEYNNAALGTVIGQSLSAGTMVDAGQVLVVTTSAYLPRLETSSNSWVGKDYLEMIAVVDEWNAKGSNIMAGAWEKDDSSTAPAGTITAYTCLFADGTKITHPDGDKVIDDNGCTRPLPIDAKISIKVSTGKGATSSETGDSTETPETPVVPEGE